MLLLLSLQGRAISIKGFVRDEKGAGIPGVAIGIVSSPEVHAMTKSDGGFIINLQNPVYTVGSDVEFLLSKDGYLPNVLTTRQGIRKEGVGMTLSMNKIDANTMVKITGTIEDQKKFPIIGATVMVKETMQCTTTGNKGQYILSVSRALLNQDIHLKAYKAKYQVAERSVAVTLGGSPVNPIQLANEINAKNLLLPETANTSPKPASTYLNFFKDKGDPSLWFTRARQFKMTSTDIKSDSAQFGFARFYVSGDHERKSIFGLGWHHTYESKIDLDRSSLSAIYYRHFDGSEIIFKPTAELNGLLRPLQAIMPELGNATSLQDIYRYERRTGQTVFEKLTAVKYLCADVSIFELRMLPNGYQINSNRDNHYFFNPSGQLERIEELKKDPVQLIYNLDGRLEGLKNSRNTLRFVYNAEKLIDTIDEGTGLKLAISYDHNGCLSQLRKNDTIISSFYYDQQNRMRRFMDNVNGKKNITIIAYDENGDKKSVTDESGAITWTYQTDRDSLRLDQHFIRFQPGGEGVVDQEKSFLVQYRLNYKSGELSLLKQNKPLKTYQIAACGCNTLGLREGERTISYEYDYLGFLAKKTTPEYVFDIAYNDQWEKIDTLRVTDRKTKAVIELWTLAYGLDGSLSRISDGMRSIEMISNSSTRIEMTYSPVPGQPYHVRVDFAKQIPAAIFIENIGTLHFDDQSTFNTEAEESKRQKISGIFNDIKTALDDFGKIRARALEIDASYKMIDLNDPEIWHNATVN